MNHPYGYYKVPYWHVTARDIATRAPDNRFHYLINALVRKIALFQRNTPINIEIDRNQKSAGCHKNIDIPPTEPVPESRAFLGLNITSSSISHISVTTATIGDKMGNGHFMQPTDNRGHDLLDTTPPATISTLPLVSIQPLIDILKEHDIEKINVLKRGIESWNASLSLRKLQNKIGLGFRLWRPGVKELLH